MKFYIIIFLLTRAQELCESRGGRPGLPVHNSPYGLCGHKGSLNLNHLTMSGFGRAGKANLLGWLSRVMWGRFRFGSPFSSNVVVVLVDSLIVTLFLHKLLIIKHQNGSHRCPF